MSVSINSVQLNPSITWFTVVLHWVSQVSVHVSVSC